MEGIKAPVENSGNGSAAGTGSVGANGSVAAMGKTPLTADELYQGEKCTSLVLAARTLQKQGKSQEARRKLHEAMAVRPNDCGALELLGDMYLEDAEQEKAIQVFRRGLELYPAHKAFEEKIGLAHLDLDESRRDQMLREQVRNGGGDVQALLQGDLQPKINGFLYLLPGAIHFAMDETERGAMFLGAWLFTLLGWMGPLNYGYYLANNDEHVRIVSLSTALDHVDGILMVLMWGMFIAFLSMYIFAALDAARLRARAEAERRYVLGI